MFTRRKFLKWIGVGVAVTPVVAVVVPRVVGKAGKAITGSSAGRDRPALVFNKMSRRAVQRKINLLRSAQLQWSQERRQAKRLRT